MGRAKSVRQAVSQFRASSGRDLSVAFTLMDAVTALIGERPQDHSTQPYSTESLRRGLELSVRPS